MDDATLSQARSLVAGSRRIVAFTGAGVSTASGVPDFRSEGGLWETFDPSEFHYERFLSDPAGFWGLRARLTRALKLDEVEPNPCHTAMASAHRAGRLEAVITQNIDGLHQLAGVPDEDVVEVHGTTRHARCVACGGREPIEATLVKVEGGSLPPTCEACGGVVKPDVVLFGEPMPQEAFARAESLASRADLMLVAGSSLTVWPAAGLPERTLEGGGGVILVNRDPTPLDRRATVVLRGAVEVLVPRLLSR